ncbi:MAG: Uma2 family endonuclease [Xenococcaceae cyanobacterium]
MTQATIKPLTFEEFLEQYPDGQGRYELVDGDIIEMRATGIHDDVADFIADSIKDEIKRLNLDYVVKNTVIIRVETKDGQEQGRNPDVSVIDGEVWQNYRASYAALREPIQLAVEVTSTNWKDDYLQKLDEYQRLGIKEYWIVDYQAIAPVKYLGKPKTPTVFVYLLVNGQYQVSRFTRSARIISRTFPELQLTVEQIVAVSKP